jgi:large subunit ribosomal protein L30
MAKKKAADKQLQVTLRKSTSGRVKSHQACVRGLGLRRIGQVVTVNDSPEIRGMINKVDYLLDVAEL